MSNEQLSSEEIVACSKCGGVALSELVFGGPANFRSPIGYRVCCVDCENQGSAHAREDFAVSVWNEANKK